jgi:hypothetical protein
MTFNFDKPKRKKAGIILVTIGITALLCIIFFLVFGSKLLLNPGKEFETIQTIGQKTMENESISIPGFESMTIPAGKTLVSANLYNPESNACYFEISIILKSTEEEIYKSKLISPGNHLYQIELSKPLQKGTYDAIVHYDTFTLDGQTPLNGANVPFKLIVN